MGVDIKDAVSEEFSFEKEKAVAKKYAQRFQWEMILIGIGQACVWLSLWAIGYVRDYSSMARIYSS